LPHILGLNLGLLGIWEILLLNFLLFVNEGKLESGLFLLFSFLGGLLLSSNISLLGS